jgi:hypothetical protein
MLWCLSWEKIIQSKKVAFKTECPEFYGRIINLNALSCSIEPMCRKITDRIKNHYLFYIYSVEQWLTCNRWLFWKSVIFFSHSLYIVTFSWAHKTSLDTCGVWLLLWDQIKTWLRQSGWSTFTLKWLKKVQHTGMAPHRDGTRMVKSSKTHWFLQRVTVQPRNICGFAKQQPTKGTSGMQNAGN